MPPVYRPVVTLGIHRGHLHVNGHQHVDVIFMHEDGSLAIFSEVADAATPRSPVMDKMLATATKNAADEYWEMNCDEAVVFARANPIHSKT